MPDEVIPDTDRIIVTDEDLVELATTAVDPRVPRLVEQLQSYRRLVPILLAWHTDRMPAENLTSGPLAVMLRFLRMNPPFAIVVQNVIPIAGTACVLHPRVRELPQGRRIRAQLVTSSGTELEDIAEIAHVLPRQGNAEITSLRGGLHFKTLREPDIAAGTLLFSDAIGLPTV